MISFKGAQDQKPMILYAVYFYVRFPVSRSSLRSLDNCLRSQSYLRLGGNFATLPFGALDVGVLDADAFVIGAATTLDHHILYDAATGALRYDADGTGLAGSIQCATLGTGLVLSHDDFEVV